MSANGVSQRVRVIGVTLLRSGAHQTPGVRRTLQALGLKKINTTIYHKNIQPVRGMLLKVSISFPNSKIVLPVAVSLSSPHSPPPPNMWFNFLSINAQVKHLIAIKPLPEPAEPL